MKFNIKKILVSLASSLVLITSCTDDFEEINTNQNYAEQATPDLLLPGIIREMTYKWGSMGWDEGFTVAQYAARLQFTSQDRYDWSPTSDPYNGAYDSLRDVENMLRSSEGQEDLNGANGAALILKSWIYSYLTDAYGDVPYTEATQGISNDNITPSFSRQQLIYTGILEDLKSANQILKNPGRGIGGDILYGGDVLKWRKFANSLRIRLLMRLSDVDPTVATTGLNEIINDLGNNPIFENNEDAAYMQWNSDNPQSKYDTRSGSFDEVRLSLTLESRLKELNDKRLIVFAQPTSDSGKGYYSEDMADYVGMPNGLNDEAALAYSPSGNPDESGSNYISRMGILLACRACDVENASATAAQTIIMSYSELQFILAEARQRDFISVGEAATYYENGIKASFSYYLGRVVAGGWNEIVTDLAAFDTAAYLAQPKVAYTGTDTDLLSKIALQKWISLYYTGFEAWSDWRRTGMPAIIPGPDAGNGGEVPVRFQFPNSVKATNNDNYLEAIKNMGADNINTRLWWDIASN